MPAPTVADIPESSNEQVRQSGVLGPVMRSMVWPVVVGLIGFWAFLFALDQRWITSELLVRYLSAHPVSLVATGMFFVGLASLGLKLINVLYQIVDQPNVKVSQAPALAQRPEESRNLLEELDQLSTSRQDSYLGRRMRNALDFVDKTESASGLEDELKYLADIDAEKQQESFALTRILIWAIPMLGFLGTVIGISAALGSLSVESDFNQMLTGLKEKLYVAFDTTALALTLSIVLMFAQFIVNRLETQLLETVDERAGEELSGRFVTFGTNRDPYLASVERMSHRVLDSIAEAGEQQAEVWNQGLAAIQETTDSTLGKFAGVLANRLSQQLEPILDELGVSLRSAINESNTFLDRHGNRLAEAMESSVEAMDRRNQIILQNLQESSETLQQTLAGHSQGLQQCLASSDEIVQHHLQEIRQVMKKTVELVTNQTQQVALGVENSHEIIRSNSNSIQQALESAHESMGQHSAQLGEVVKVSSQVLEEHAEKISDAVTRSEQIVDKRQETIFQTQESMLKAQVQQSMAISSFTEKLEALEQIMQQSGSLESMQNTLNETLSTLERSDTIANEINGLARLVREQVKSVDRSQFALAQSSEKQLAGIVEHTQKVYDQNSQLLSHYQNKIDELVKSIVQHQDNQSVDQLTQIVKESFQTLTLQLVNQNQSLAQLQDQMRSSLDGEQLSDAIQQMTAQSNQSSQNSERLDSSMQELARSVAALNHSREQSSHDSTIEFGRTESGQPDTPKRVA